MSYGNIHKYDVNESGCWVWNAASRNGYGRLWIKGRIVSAHRHFYELKNGPIPKGLVLDHKCRNPSCVNPDHLEPVTHTVNCLRGSKPVVTQEAYEKIMLMFTGGATQRAIAKEVRLSRATVWNVIKGKRKNFIQQNVWPCQSK